MFQLAFCARWMQGAVTVDWLLAHPEWYEAIDICATAHGQAEAQRAQDGASGS